MKRVKRKLFVLAGLGGIATVAYKKLFGGKDDTWEGSYESAAASEPGSAEDVKPEPAAATGDQPADETTEKQD